MLKDTNSIKLAAVLRKLHRRFAAGPLAVMGCWTAAATAVIILTQPITPQRLFAKNAI
jgi:hypothetical protein